MEEDLGISASACTRALSILVHPESFPIKHCTLRHQLGATCNCGDIWRELPLVLFSERTLLGWHLVDVPFSTLPQTVAVFKLQDSCNKRRCIVLVLSWPIILLSSRTRKTMLYFDFDFCHTLLY